MKDPDIFGNALLDYDQGTYSEDVVVHSSIAEDDIIPVPYLFRSFENMPVIEQEALKRCKGSTLDIGCCAGSHVLWLKNNGINIEGIDVSQGAVALSRKRTKATIYQNNILDHKGSYDTLILLMNGTGIFEKISMVDTYLIKLQSLLKSGGQILIDSSDISYMFEDEDGGFWVDTHLDYYGEVTYAMSYKGEKGVSFNWLYLDYERLKWLANKNELNCDLIYEGDHYEYLARLTPIL